MRPTFSHRLIAAFGILTLAAAALAPASLAADVSDIGFVDQAALANVGSFTAANRELAQYKTGLDREFSKQIRGTRDQGTQSRIAQSFQNKLALKQRELFAPLFSRAQVAIASVASSKNLSVILDKRIMIYGGQDVTQSVINLLAGPGDPVPPVSSPPPSNVGFVDQSQIDNVPQLKAANDDMQKYQAQQQQIAQTKMRAAKTDPERQQILKDYQNALSDKQKQEMTPLVDKTRDAIAGIAKKKGLVLVVDRTNLIYGGTDITSDVTTALK